MDNNASGGLVRRDMVILCHFAAIIPFIGMKNHDGGVWLTSHEVTPCAHDGVAAFLENAQGTAVKKFTPLWTHKTIWGDANHAQKVNFHLIEHVMSKKMGEPPGIIILPFFTHGLVRHDLRSGCLEYKALDNRCQQRTTIAIPVFCAGA
jgi:hypothetical protein